jgi:glycosyltransferase involved in cell wall biosynthesis
MVRASVVIPTVSTREQMRRRARASAEQQTVPVDVIVVEDVGFTGEFRQGGAAETRNRGLEQVETEWVTFLDDDDQLYPQHVERCLALADETDADLVYPWWDGANEDLFRVMHEGKLRTPEGLPFDETMKSMLLGDYDWHEGRDAGNYIPVTVLVRTALIRQVGGFPVPGSDDWPHRNGEDHGLWVRLLRAGARFEHLPERTWKYWLHGKHLSGA